ncbi:MAG: hypothetical protein K6G65_01520 [Lachnospiraceae bacterium]|nr:hypothetical protein [Lachnospiraceae bacterium]
MNESSFSLLSQEEIDTLVDFLSSKQSELSSEVLNQESIDKLINLITNNDLNKIRIDAMDTMDILPPSMLVSIPIRKDAEDVCELLVETNPETKYIELIAKNQATGETHPIIPASLDRLEVVEGISSWGYSIAPILFDKIARIFSLKYSRETYEKICAIYADINFGNKEEKLPAMYYPTSAQLLDNLL